MECLKKYLCCCCAAAPSPPVSTFVSVAETKSPPSTGGRELDREMDQVQKSVADRFTNIGVRAVAIRDHVSSWTVRKITIDLVLQHMVEQSRKADLIRDGSTAYSDVWSKDGRESLHAGLGMMEEELDLMEESMKLTAPEVKEISE